MSFSASPSIDNGFCLKHKRIPLLSAKCSKASEPMRIPPGTRHIEDVITCLRAAMSKSISNIFVSRSPASLSHSIGQIAAEVSPWPKSIPTT